MKFPEFETAVIALASEGTRLTSANVVAALKVRPATAEAWLEKMAKDGRLDVDVDEDEAVLVYRVKGLSVKTQPARTGGAAARLARNLDAWEPPARAQAAGSRGTGSRALAVQKRSVVVGALLGLIPGVGLFYAAPIPIAALATVAVLVTVAVLKFIAIIPLLGGLLWMVGIAALAVVSALLGAMYAHLYNQHGKRTHIGRTGERKLTR